MSVPSIGSNLSISGYTAVQCTGNPEQDAKSFADANGISVEEAKSILQSTFGAPGAAPSATNSDVADVTKVSKDEDSVLDVSETNETGTTNAAAGLTDDKKSAIQTACDNLVFALQEEANCYQNWVNNPNSSDAQAIFWNAVTRNASRADELAAVMQGIDESLLPDEVKNTYQTLLNAIKNEDDTYVAYQQGGSFDDFNAAKNVRYDASAKFLECLQDTGFLK